MFERAEAEQGHPVRRDTDWRPCGEFLPMDVTGWAYGRRWQSLSPEETIELGPAIRVRTGDVASHIGRMRRLILSLVLTRLGRSGWAFAGGEF